MTIFSASLTSLLTTLIAGTHWSTRTLLGAISWIAWLQARWRSLRLSAATLWKQLRFP
jgi:hypothetical protein